MTFQFSPTEESRTRVSELATEEIGRRLILPSPVMAEFIKAAGPRIDEDAAKTRLR